MNKFASLVRQTRENKELSREDAAQPLLTAEFIEAVEEGVVLPGIPHKIGLQMGLGIKRDTDEYKQFTDAWYAAYRELRLSPSRGLVFLD